MTSAERLIAVGVGMVVRDFPDTFTIEGMPGTWTGVTSQRQGALEPTAGGIAVMWQLVIVVPRAQFPPEVLSVLLSTAPRASIRCQDRRWVVVETPYAGDPATIELVCEPASRR